jgi:hypothetical protein
MLVDQITPHLPTDNEEVNVHVKGLQAMLDAATVADQAHYQGNRDRDHDDDHQRSPSGDSASHITPLEGHGEGNCDMHDIIHGRDVRGRIKSWR